MTASYSLEVFSRKRLLGRPVWYFHILARNGQIVAQSQGYSRRLDAKATAEHLRDRLGFAGEIRDV